MNNIDKAYTDLLQDILDNGVEKSDRTGTGTISVFGRQIRHKMSEGFPLLTTKKMHWKSIVTELLWFLRGDTNIKFLLDYDCHIWDGDAYKNYLKGGDIKWLKQTEVDTPVGKMNIPIPYTKEEFINKIKTDDEFAKKWGDLGKIYGFQWRNWDAHNKYDIDPEPIDQIQNLINELKSNPDSRRLMVSAWNVGELDQMVLPPCHYGFQVYTRELSVKEKEWQLEKTNCINDIENDKIIYGHEWDEYINEQYKGIQSTQGIKLPTRAISLMWNQRSVDSALGWPFNIASYALLLMIIAKEVNMIPDEVICNLGDCHIYKNQIDGVKEQIGRDLTDEERYNIWFDNNVTSGMERFFDPNNLPNFNDPYYEPTPKRTREPYELPTLVINDEFWNQDQGIIEQINYIKPDDFFVNNYKSHPKIKMPLSN